MTKEDILCSHSWTVTSSTGVEWKNKELDEKGSRKY